MKSRLTYFLLMALVLTLALWLRVGDLSQLPPGLSSDEAQNANYSFHLSRTGRFPFYENYGEPEPLFRFVLAAAIPFFGAHIWTMRLTSALIGVVGIAAACWAARECLMDTPPASRRLAGIAAAAALASAVGHLTLSRSLYRAIPLPIFIFLFVGFLLRALRRKRIADAALSGASLAAGAYTYTAGFVVPLSLAPLALSLVIFQRQAWKDWTRSLAILIVTAAVLLAPVGYLIATNPARVFGRAAEVTRTSVSETSSVIARLAKVSGSALLNLGRAFFVEGDGDVQYNSDSAPVIPQAFQLIFVAGLIALLLRIRRPVSALALPLVFIMAIPAVVSIEPAHGLRISGMFGAFPLVVGAGAEFLVGRVPMWFPSARRVVSIAMVALLGIAVLAGIASARITYTQFWQKPTSIFMFGRDLSYGEWFFRTDQRDFAQWLSRQRAPLMVPLEEMSRQTDHAWLLDSFPNVRTAGGDFATPPDTLVVAPYTLEAGGYSRETRHYALLNDGTITLLPPITIETHTALISNLDAAETVYRGNGAAMAKVIALSFDVKFESQQVSGTLNAPLVSLKNGMQVIGWHGPNTLRGDSEQTVTYTLDWSTSRPQRHDYFSFVGLLTHDLNRKAGVDAEMLRWLYPTWAWEANTTVPVPYTFTVPANLETGAYRLVVTMGGDFTTIGWVKVPQKSQPDAAAGSVHPNAVFGDSLSLYGASAADGGNGIVQLSLYWESLVERPNFDATIFIHALDRNRALIAQADEQPWQGQYPTFIWSEGERVRTDYLLNIGGVSPDDVEVWVGAYTFPTLARLPVAQDDQPVKDNRLRLGKLRGLLTIESQIPTIMSDRPAQHSGWR